MARVDLEERVSRLEQQVNELRQRLQAEMDPAKRTTDIEKVTGFFGNDPTIKRIFRYAEKYREDDRKRAKRKFAKSRRSKS